MPLSTVATLPALFEQSADRFGPRPMILEKVDGAWKSFTYDDIRTLVHRCAAGLIRLGVNKQDRIALISEGRKEWVVAELGILYAGGVNVPISVKIEELSDLHFRLSHAGCRVVIASGNQARKILGMRQKLPELERIILFDALPEMAGEATLFADLLEEGEGALRADPALAERAWRSLTGDDLANICYTSGTVADPKGIILTHRNYTANVAQSTTLYPLPPTARTLLVLPWDHAFAHTCGIYALSSTGGCFACVPLGRTPMETLRNIPSNIKEVRPTFLMSVPALAKNFRKGIERAIREKGPLAERLFSLGLRVAYAYNGMGSDRGDGWRMLLKAPLALFELILFSRIRQNFGGQMEYFIGGGALLDIELQRFFYAIGIPMYQGYGLTEASPVISANTPTSHRLGSSGRLVPELELKICNEKGESLPVGERGEIVVRGENVMAGYWRNPEATAETLRGGWLFTGDLGYMSADGFLYVLGREKSLLIGHDGEKYSPEGIEETITEHSPHIDQIMLHNDQSPSTVALLVPNREALVRTLKHRGIPVDSPKASDAALRILDDDLAVYRTGGRHAGEFPDRWLPSAFAVLSESFTEQNRFLNSTLKMVRGRIGQHHAARIATLYTAEGRNVCSLQNRAEIEVVLGRE